MMTRRGLALAVKRGIDVIGASAGLILVSPLLVAIALALLIQMGRPILFRQRRPGYRGEPFWLVKFRTMRPLGPGEVPYVSDEQRLTSFGRFLRNSALDELPELWNVVRGEMSLIGPRPLLMEYLDTYAPDERRRHDMPAGMTGWAAVNGRHTLKFKDWLQLDLWYVDHWSLRLDLEILLRTLYQVV
jgi:lipopolysaccharide/colanic/teichoic acid biosynthesis glycosyltransferase